MRCITIAQPGREIERLKITERPDLQAAGENVRVQVLATALNRADILQRRGFYPAPRGTVQDIPGLEFVGIVDQLGESVTRWRGGERVMGIVAGGSYAEQVVSHQDLLVAVPDALSDTDAAAMPEVYMTAHDALVTLGGLRPGHRVLVHAAAGGVGSAAIQIARAFGALEVYGSSQTQSKLDSLPARIGAFRPVLSQQGQFISVVQEQLPTGQGFDVILDVLGGAAMEQNVQLLAQQGRIVVVGVMAGPNAELPLAQLMAKRGQIIGTVLRSRTLADKIAATRAFEREIVPLLAQGILKPVVDSVYSFDQIHAATERMEANANTGKIILHLHSR